MWIRSVNPVLSCRNACGLGPWLMEVVIRTLLSASCANKVLWCTCLRLDTGVWYGVNFQEAHSMCTLQKNPKKIKDTYLKSQKSHSSSGGDCLVSWSKKIEQVSNVGYLYQTSILRDCTGLWGKQLYLYWSLFIVVVSLSSLSSK